MEETTAKSQEARGKDIKAHLSHYGITAERHSIFHAVGCYGNKP